MRLYFSRGPEAKCEGAARLLGRILLLAAVAIAPAWKAAFAQDLTEEAKKEVAQGDALFQHRRYDKALEAYRKADKLSHNASAVCLLRMVRAERKLGDLDAAMDHAKKAVKVAGDNKVWAAAAHFVVGSLLADEAGKPNDKKWKESEQEFRQALALAPSVAVVHYQLGLVLMKQERDAEGIAEMKAYLAMPGGDAKVVAKAQQVEANPVFAREPLAPNFSFPTIEGATISNSTLRGKVVLLDFWATWCEACRESVPTLRDIRKKYANREFELVGISADDDESTCKSFADKNRMDWKEHADLSGQVRDAFEIEALPTYVVLDKDGVVRLRRVGFGSSIGSEIEEAVDKALKKAPDPKLAAAVAAASSAETTGRPEIAETIPGQPGSDSSAAAESDDDPVENGTVTGNLYHNEELGLSCRFPGGWTAAKPEALRARNAATYAAMKTALEKQARDMPGEVHMVVPRTIFYASPRGGGSATSLDVPSILITATEGMMEELSLDSVAPNARAFERAGLKMMGEPQEFAAGEQHCFRTDFADTARTPQRWLTRIDTTVEGYVISVQIIAGSQQELSRIAATAGSLAFAKQ
jgi:thiol-disulfide isomerase/thioredoxin